MENFSHNRHVLDCHSSINQTQNNDFQNKFSPIQDIKDGFDKQMGENKTQDTYQKNQLAQKSVFRKQNKEKNLSICQYSINGWSMDEQIFLLEQYMEKGPKWTTIASNISKKYTYYTIRSENDVKNKFYGGLRKFLRTINQTDKIAKQLKYQSIMRILECKQKTKGLPQVLMNQAIKIREKIVRLMGVSQREPLNPQVIVEIHQKVNKFNLSTRNYKFKKSSTRHSHAKYEKVPIDERKKQQNKKEDSQEIEKQQKEDGGDEDSFFCPLMNNIFGRTQENLFNDESEAIRNEEEAEKDMFELPGVVKRVEPMWRSYNLQKQYNEIVGESYVDEQPNILS